MKNKWISLVSLGLTLGMCSPSYAYVMVRSGFGELKHDGDIGSFHKHHGTDSKWGVHNNADDDNEAFSDSSFFARDANCTKGNFEYKNHKNLSVALGGRINVLDIGDVGIELEILGGYANFKNKKRDPITLNLIEGKDAGAVIAGIHNRQDMPTMERPDFLMVEYKKWGLERIACIRPMYLSNQRTVGAQVNIYWEQYLFDWLSAGIGGGIGGAYVCTKFTTREMYRILDVQNFDAGGGNANHYVWGMAGQNKTRSKYAHTGALMYNFMLFVRAEKFETLFEVGYRHIGLHQMFDNKVYGEVIPKLGNMYSDQVYLGVGRTF